MNLSVSFLIEYSSQSTKVIDKESEMKSKTKGLEKTDDVSGREHGPFTWVR